ncbi:MAG: type I pullulanase [Butyrivibrio sp.]|nr:type I pullulanase [Acetatifactor muris]MCM1561025.1 type I pullulanase [Butyrivibrio sp.]
MFIYTREFDEQYEYKGKDLGAVCGESGTVFKLWAPLAEQVALCLYGDGAAPEKVLPMEKEERGVWQLEFSENMHGVYYDYLVTVEGKTRQTADPYARACGCNGRRSMAVDLERTNPEGFRQEKPPEIKPETIIYELHVKDFSHDPESGIPRQFRGRYKAFTFPGKEGGPGQMATGVAYLRQLGITHVHLLPVFDFGWLDESGDHRQFNWGYDPVNFNVPEGSFATDAADGAVRIRECKEMIQALHRAGIRVVMDVVYNHMYDRDSWFERVAPGYYCRRWEDGELSDGSACGNDMAAGRAMVDNYIADSVRYWAGEYHVDGFRFDLMGLLTTDLMNRIRRELDAVFGPGEKLLYGEPWRAAESPMEKGTRAALKENIGMLQDSIAVFSDDTRDVIKGDVFVAEKPGFVNGGRGLEERILHAVTGWRDNTEGFRPNSCSQIINYVSAHDNFTLWDKLLVTMEGNTVRQAADYLEPRPAILAANKLAAFICFTCQGRLFLQAGEEFGRTKFGDDNSYRSAPEINMLRWGQTERFRELVEYYRGLISLRLRLPGLYDKSRDAWRRIQAQTVHGAGLVSFRVDNRLGTEDGETEWEELLIYYNASDKSFPVELPGASNLGTERQETGGRKTGSQEAGDPETGVQKISGRETGDGERPWAEWEILADDACADCRKPASGRPEVKACSGILLGKRAKIHHF